MGTFWPCLLGIVLSFTALADSDRASFSFRGQADEAVTLERVIVETRHRTEMQDDTCTRQVPYQAEECGYETRYRQECRWIPAREECGRRDERRCRSVTRYRQECSQGPSRRECQTFPGGQVCSNGPSREICEDRSGHEECREVNGRRVCRRTGGRVCRTVPGERVCREAPPQTRCREIPGERHCRQVPYNDQECTTESVPWCRTIPGENRCEQVPYQEYQCRQVTRYRTETYACQRPVQVPYQVNVPVKAQLEVLFANPDFSVEVPFVAGLSPAKVIELSAQAPAGVLVGTRPAAPQETAEGEGVLISQRIHVQLVSLSELERELNQQLSDVVIDFTAKKLSFTAQGKIELHDSVEVVLEGRKKQLFSTVVGRAHLKGELKALGASLTPRSGGVLVQLDLAQTDLTKISDKKNFKLKLAHIKGLAAGFGWSAGLPEIKSEKEAAAEVVR